MIYKIIYAITYAIKEKENYYIIGYIYNIIFYKK